MEVSQGSDHTFTSALIYAKSRLCFCREFKAKQVEGMRELFYGNDVFLWLPTGYGKSVCYQALPFLFDVKLERTALPPSEQSVCLVISPLLSLMTDQVFRLKSIGIGSGIMSGSSGVDKSLLATEAQIKLGSYRILFSAPEAILETASWRNVLTEEPLQSQLVAIAVDEAHCVYKWGTGFRPSYGDIHELRSLLPSSTPMLAATATVTNAMLKSITRSLNMIDYKLVHLSPERSNISFGVENRTTIENDLKHIMDDLKMNSVKANRVLIYCQSLNMCSNLYAHFLYMNWEIIVIILLVLRR